MKNATISSLIFILMSFTTWAQNSGGLIMLNENTRIVQKTTKARSANPKEQSLKELLVQENADQKKLEKLKDKIERNRPPRQKVVRRNSTLPNAQLKLQVVNSAVVNQSSNLSIGNDPIRHLKDDPQARLAFELLKTKDPKTGRIPENIRLRESEFMKIQNEKIGIPMGAGDLSSAWVNRGPHNVGGRTRALGVDIRDENIILAGGVSGGMWKSTDQGASWTKTTGSNELQSVTCIAQDTRSGFEDTWYYGTGEISGNSAGSAGAAYSGDGIYKSDDNGQTWSLLSSTSTDTPESFDQGFDYNYEVFVNPVNGNLLVANYFGIYASSDQGSTFDLVLEKNGTNTGRWVDVVITSAGIAYAVIDEKGVFSSADGTNWTDITPTNNYPLVDGERKEIALAASNENVFYIIGEDASRAVGHSLWKYDDGTDIWTDLSDNLPQLGGLTGDFTSQGGYDLLIKVKPDDENFVVIGGTNLFASSDGFSTTSNTSWIGGYTANNDSYGLYTNHHPDQHSFVFLSNNRALSGNDGGVQLTNDVTDITTNGNSETVDWIWLNNGYLTSQVYALSAGPGDQIMAGFQDNSTWLTTTNVTDATWTDQFGGDGAYNAFNQDGSVRYMSSQNGNIYRVNYTDGADDTSADGFTQFNPDGYSAGLFIVPFYLDPVIDDVFYLAGSSTFYVNTQASTGSSSTGWKTIDLGTQNTISEIGVTNANIVYVGTTGGEVFKIEDPAGNESVTNVTGSNFPSGYVSGLGVNPLNANEIVITFSNYSIQSVFHSVDAGGTWADVSGNLEENTDGSGSGPSVRAAQILGNGDRYFVGTSTGLYSTTSLSGGTTVWVQENSSGIGNVVVEHLVARTSDGLVLAGTHGNGIYSANFETQGQAENDLSLAYISNPNGDVNSVETIEIVIINRGSNDQSGGFEVSYSVNDVEISTETISESINSGDTIEYSFTTTYDFSAAGEYSIKADVALNVDEVAENNSKTILVANALFTGGYVLQQLEPTSSGTSSIFGNGYLFSQVGIESVDIEYIDQNKRKLFLAYLPQFGTRIKDYEFTLNNGDVIFSDSQPTGIGCGGDIQLGTADTPGAYTDGDDLEFTLTLKEDLLDDCGTGITPVDVTFLLTKQLNDDLVLTTINAPASQEFNGEHPISISILNVGTNEQSGFSVSYYINDVLESTKNINAIVGSGEMLNYTFPRLYDFSEPGDYNLRAVVNLGNDENASNNVLSKDIEIIRIDGFQGPYSLEQIEPTTSGASAAFAGGYLFDQSGSTSISIDNLGGNRRQFSAAYLPTFGTGVSNFIFSLNNGETFFDDNQDAGIGCGSNILLGTADTQGTFDINDDSEFTLNIKEIDTSCGADTVDVAFRLTKVPAYHDLSVIESFNITPNFYGQIIQVDAFVFNYGNVPENEFSVTYSVDGVEIETQTFNVEIFPNQGRTVVFNTPFDFSVSKEYEVSMAVNLEGDEFPDNDGYTEIGESYPAISDFPYLQTFDNDDGNLPLGWVVFNGNWELNNQASTNLKTGPGGDATSGTGYYMNSDAQNSLQHRLSTRQIDLTGLNSPMLTFNYHMFGTPTTSLEVTINNQSIYSIIGEQQENQADSYKKARINLAPFTEQIVTIHFLTTSGGQGLPEVVAIDDIGVQEALEHDLAMRSIMSPVRVVDGVEAISATIANLGKRAQTEFNMSYYVNGTKIATEQFNDVITAGNSADFTFEEAFDFTAAGTYEISVEVDLPTDELINNNTFTRNVISSSTEFIGGYEMNQPLTATVSASANFGSGYLFSGSQTNKVQIKYVDETTRSLSLAYLTEFGNGERDYFFTFSNGEITFVDEQGVGLGCNNEILLGTADAQGVYIEGDDNEFSMTIKEDASNDCGVSEDILFSLIKIGGGAENDLEVSFVSSPQNNIPLSRQAVSFQIQNVGTLPQGNFDAAYYVNDVHVATETFFQNNNLLRAGFSRNYTFNTAYDFTTIDVYDIKVVLTRAADDNPNNDENSIQIQTSPFNINAIPIENEEIGVEWITLADVTDVVLERSVDGGDFEELTSIGDNETFLIDQDVDENSQYAYRLKGMSEGAQTYSLEVFAQPTISDDYAFEKVLGDITGVDISNNTYSASWGDLDDDGDLDLVVSNVPNFNQNLSILDQPTIYLNDGDGNFDKVADNTILLDGVSSRTTSLIDYNNDGKVDVYSPALNSRIGDHRERLFQNNGNLDFTSVEVPGFNRNNTSSTEDGVWGDMDNDGDLDLFITGSYWAGFQDFLFENLGDGRLKSIRAGVIYESMYNSGMFSWTASWVDYDGDGDQDLFVPNDNAAAPPKMFRNLGDGTFEEDFSSDFVTQSQRVRGAQWADFDQNGSIDLMMIHNNVGPIFFFNDGAGSFTRITSMEALGIDLNIHRISTVGDINNNGKLDIVFVSNGYFVYESNNDETFTLLNDIFPPTGSEAAFAGISLGDMDGDGDLDMFRGNASSGNPFNFLYENKGNTNNWLHIELKGEFSNADGIGAKIALTTGSDTQYRDITSSTGLIGQNSLIAEFGLGMNTMVDHIVVTWPSGTIKELFDINANQLIEINDSNAPSDVGLSNAGLPENLGNGAAIGASFSVDDDAEDNFTYEIVAGGIPGGANLYTSLDQTLGNKDLLSPVSKETSTDRSSSIDNAQIMEDSENFIIENGTIKAAGEFDFETQSSYSIRVRTTDSFGNTFEKVINIDILDVNEDIENSAPSDITLSNARINENEAKESIIGTLSANDTDEGSTHTYSLVDGDAPLFIIDGDVLKTNAEFNFEKKSSYTITVRTIDNGGLSLDKEYTISVDNVNEEPLELFLDNTTLGELSVPGSLVGNLSTTDIDLNDEHTYTLSGTDAASFQILGSELLTLDQLDFETKTSYEFTVTSTDSEGLTLSEDYIIDVFDENDAPSSLQISSLTIDELKPSGSVVGDLSTTDDDLTDTHTYALSGADASKFKILLNELRTVNEFDFESENEYNVSVTVTDNRGQSLSEDFTININDVNDIPSVLTLSNNKIPEEVSSGITIGALSTADQDENDTHTFAFVSGDGDTDNGSFTIDGKTLKSAIQFDFETKNSYSIRTLVSDGNGGELEQQFDITIIDIDENNPNSTPSNINISATNVSENIAIGSVVGTLSTIDSDSEDTHTYEIIDGDASLFLIDGSSLKTNTIFNYEKGESYSITVRTTDNGGLIYDEQINITIANVNEAPNSISLSGKTLEEGKSSGTTIGTMTTTDDDSGDSHTYMLSGTDADKFQFSNSELQNKEEFDFETNSSYSITITSTDIGGLTLSQDYTIEVQDKNEAPSSIALSNSQLEEGKSLGSLIGDLSTTDEDVNDTHSYTLSGDDASSFRIVIDEIRSEVEFNFETKSSYNISVTSTDSDGLTTTANMTIDIVDVNDAPTAISLDVTELDENAVSGTVISSINVTDEDGTDTHTFEITGNDAEDFQIVGNELQTASDVNFELKSIYNIGIIATDAGQETIRDEFVISIKDINEAPTSVVLSNTEVNENSGVGIVVGAISFSDEDSGDTHTLSLDGADASNFEIVGNEILSTSDFNFEAQASLSLDVIVTDAASLSATENYTINVIDINEAPTAIELSNLEIEEGNEIGAVIGDITVTDEDTNDSHTYVLSGTDAASFEIVNNELRSTESFEFDVKSSYSISIEAMDSEFAKSENFTITVSMILSFDEDDRLVKVYPNPSKGIFTIALDANWRNSEWKLFDLKGKLVQSTNGIVELNESSIQVDVRNLPNGEYILKLLNDNKEITKQIIISK